jgi:hypothetical protein
MSSPQKILAFFAAGAVVVAAACNRTPEPLTPEAASAKGDALLREMSKNVAALQTFAYSAEERREQVSKGGAKTEVKTTRRVIVRRPNGIAFTGTGDRGETAGWYDGKQLTLVSNREKVWARGPMPPTLDEALDFLSAEYALHMPTADLLYSSPYDALMTKDTTGGWVDVQRIGDRDCDHLAYRQQVVDWEIWLDQNSRMPCQLKITYKTDPGQPTTTVAYRGLETPPVTDETFAAKVPEGYQRIKIIRHATVVDPKLGETASDAAPATAQPAKKKRAAEPAKKQPK